MGSPNAVVAAIGFIDTFILPFPLPAGLHDADELAVASIDEPGVDLPQYPSVGDEDGDGQDELAFVGLAAVPCFGVGGVATFLGPFADVGLDPIPSSAGTTPSWPSTSTPPRAPAATARRWPSTSTATATARSSSGGAPSSGGCTGHWSCLGRRSGF